MKIDLDTIKDQRVVDITPLSEIGCCTEGCDGEPTHVALVIVGFDNGQQMSAVRHFCSLCALAYKGLGKNRS